MRIVVLPVSFSLVISKEQRCRSFLGFVGSHAPHTPPKRGTPPEEPQPRILM